MNAVQYNSIAFIIELAKIFLAAVCVLPVKMRNIRFFLFAAGLSVTGISIISINIDLYQYGFIYGILSIVIVCIVLEKYPLKIGYIILSYIVICLIDMFFEIVLTYIVEIDTVDILYSIWALLINSISLFILLFIFIYKIKSKKLRQKAYLSGRQIAVFIVLGLSVGVYTAYFELFEIEIRRFQSLAVSGLVISIVITLGICAALISADYENKNLKFQNDISEKLISQQKDYYLMLLKQGEETKKIRHDFKNHIYAMHILLQNKQLDKLDQYFSDMNTLIEGKDTELHTGNNLVDAIVIHQLSKYDEVELKWQGKIPIDIAITEMVLCTVFSNLLSNAFEAVDGL